MSFKYFNRVRENYSWYTPKKLDDTLIRFFSGCNKHSDKHEVKIKKKLKGTQKVLEALHPCKTLFFFFLGIEINDISNIRKKGSP